MSAYAEIEALVHKLGAARARLWSAVRRLDPGDFIRPFDDGWSFKETLAHVAAAEEINVKFGKLMVSQQQPVQLEAFGSEYPDFSGQFTLDGFNAYLTERLRSRSLDQVLTGLEETRSRTLAWVETLTPDHLERGGQHAVWGDHTVRDMLRILALHDRLHTNDILKRKNQVDG